MSESERFLPGLIDRLEKILEEQGLRHDSITLRTTGCPNGCARPWVSEIVRSLFAVSLLLSVPEAKRFRRRLLLAKLLIVT